METKLVEPVCREERYRFRPEAVALLLGDQPEADLRFADDPVSDPEGDVTDGAAGPADDEAGRVVLVARLLNRRSLVDGVVGVSGSDDRPQVGMVDVVPAELGVLRFPGAQFDQVPLDERRELIGTFQCCPCRRRRYNPRAVATIEDFLSVVPFAGPKDPISSIAEGLGERWMIGRHSARPVKVKQ